jgi:predicted nucleotidyltransferase
MTNTLKMNLSNVREGALKEVYDAVEEAFKALEIDYYLIGAIARDTWYARAKKEPRKTFDVDFAALVGSNAEYEQVKQYLKDHKQYQETKGNAFVMIAPSGMQVDILPFGEIEIDDDIRLEGNGLTTIKVNGFKEVYDNGTQSVEMDTGHTFQVATLSAIVMLKLISYDDRPEQRLKDAGDIGNIIIHFVDLEPDLIYAEENLDLYTGDDPNFEMFSMQGISAVIIGREIKKIIEGNENLLNRIQAILVDKTEKQENSPFVRRMADETGSTVAEVMDWIVGLKKGMEIG